MAASLTVDTPVTFSERAVAEVRALLEQENRPSDALRVFVSGAGCSGLQYGMGIDTEAQEGDTEFWQHGLRILIDGQSLTYMVGSSVEFIEDPNGGGFKIDNPNASSGCGSCGGGCGPAE